MRITFTGSEPIRAPAIENDVALTVQQIAVNIADHSPA
jgi:hypothetical protein